MMNLQQFADAREKAGIKVKKINNGFRHSYASYRIAEVKSLPQVAWEMNTSERKLLDNYLELVSAKKLAKKEPTGRHDKSLAEMQQETHVLINNEFDHLRHTHPEIYRALLQKGTRIRGYG